MNYEEWWVVNVEEMVVLGIKVIYHCWVQVFQSCNGDLYDMQG